MTSATLLEHGLHVDVEADPHTIPGLVEAVRNDSDTAVIVTNGTTKPAAKKADKKPAKKADKKPDKKTDKLKSGGKGKKK